MPKTTDTYVIRNPKQMAALRAPTRQEIVDVLDPMGEASIAELAAALGRPADALYYHIRILRKVGLVLPGRERTPRHDGQTFRTPAPLIKLAYEPGMNGNRKSVTPIVDAMLRLTMRNFARAFRHADTIVEGDHRELWAIRTTGWLTKDQLGKVNSYIAALMHTTVKSSQAKGRLFGLTMVLTPLDRHTGKKQPATSKFKSGPRKSSQRRNMHSQSRNKIP
jgi:DNA-binding transcriptional ArsR family regulator